MVRLLFCACFLYALSAAAEPPNLVLIVADDLGYGELSCQGNAEIPTPNIDSIAANGVRFTQGYVTAAYCSASRAGFLTGRYQTRFGYEFNPTGHHSEDPDAGLPLSQVTLAEHLVEAGYVTSLVGKWHLGGTAKFHPFRHGFDEFFGFTHEGHYFVPPPYRGVVTMERRLALPGGGDGRWISEDGRTIYSTHMNGNEPDYDANNPIVRGGQPVVETEYLTDALTREAVDFIDRSQDRPFFLNLAYNAVHSPLQGADAYMEKFAHIEDVHRRIFAAMLANMDDSVGEVLGKLRETGLDDNTIVVFFSDNGGPTRELTSSNGALRDGKGSVYEGGLRVPFLMQWPAKLEGGQVFTKPVISLDVFATIAATRPDPPRNLDGVDLLPFLTGVNEGNPHETLFWRLGPKTALRSGDWKLLKNPQRGQEPKWELYNLAEDSSESRDLAEENPERVQQLLKVWSGLNGEMEEPFWTR
ncbi:MAG: arylsulfatase A-like enzyme [Verrucomicrobiales bacterium]|jgi:arylsulfatase A-like enzyme